MCTESPPRPPPPTRHSSKPKHKLPPFPSPSPLPSDARSKDKKKNNDNGQHRPLARIRSRRRSCLHAHCSPLAIWSAGRLPVTSWRGQSDALLSHAARPPFVVSRTASGSPLHLPACMCLCLLDLPLPVTVCFACLSALVCFACLSVPACLRVCAPDGLSCCSFFCASLACFYLFQHVILACACLPST